MTIIGILLGIAMIAGLIFAMGKMSEQGVDINDCFGCGSESCSSYGTGGSSSESCTRYHELEQLPRNGSGKE